MTTPSASPSAATDGSTKDGASSFLSLTPLSDVEAQRAVDQFCELLTFETVSSIAATNGAYTACAAWLYDYMSNHLINVFDDVFYLPEAPPESPVVIGFWK